MLSEQQSRILKHVVFHKQNAFITGPGGCGKSTLINAILDALHETPTINPRTIHTTALTGCAAVLLKTNAKTLHSWAGLGISTTSLEQAITRTKFNKTARSNIKSSTFLIVDEVSMMSKSLFETLDGICKHIRKNAQPFGGIQLLFSGDFYQLPPISSRNDPDSSKFCFESPLWNQIFPPTHSFNMTTVFRQTDLEFVECLHTIRIGTLTPRQYKLLRSRYNKTDIPEQSTYLLSHRRDVDKINLENYTKLPSLQEHTFEINIIQPSRFELQSAKITPKQLQTEIKSLTSRYEESLRLKLNTRVMYRVNNPELGLINGSTGKIVDFTIHTSDDSSYLAPVVLFDNDRMITIPRHTTISEEIPTLSASQFPLTHAWAITIHKSQGATLDHAIIDIGKCFAEGQVYVALSRVRSLDGLHLIGFNPSAIRANQKVKEFYNSRFTK
jgi:ATP-dependent DNA helicase PIF1